MERGNTNQGWQKMIGLLISGGVIGALVTGAIDWAKIGPEADAKIQVADQAARRERQQHVLQAYAAVESIETGKRLRLLDALAATLVAGDSQDDGLADWIATERSKVSTTAAELKAKLAQDKAEVSALRDKIREQEAQLAAFEDAAATSDDIDAERLQALLASKQKRIERLEAELAQRNDDVLETSTAMLKSLRCPPTAVGGKDRPVILDPKVVAKLETIVSSSEQLPNFDKTRALRFRKALAAHTAAKQSPQPTTKTPPP